MSGSRVFVYVGSCIFMVGFLAIFEISRIDFYHSNQYYQLVILYGIQALFLNL